MLEAALWGGGGLILARALTTGTAEEVRAAAGSERSCNLQYLNAAWYHGSFVASSIVEGGLVEHPPASYGRRIGDGGLAPAREADAAMMCRRRRICVLWIR